MADYKFYCLKLNLFSGQEITVGKKGREYFPPGFYFYVGKGQKGIRARVARHLIPRKKKRWHIDYLTSRAFPVSLRLYPDNMGSECQIAEILAAEGGEVIMPGFGSSDCNCPSHLYYFPGSHPLPGKE